MLLTMIAAATAAQAAPQPVDCKPPDELRPIMATHTIPPYPPLSVMTGEQGATLMRLIVGPDGIPTDVQVEKSSDSVRLDQAAAEHVKANWRWQPNGKACRIRVMLTWDLKDAMDPSLLPVVFVPGRSDFPDGAVTRKEQGLTYLSVSLDAHGAVIDVQVAQGSGFTDLDNKAMALVKTHHFTAATVDGKSLIVGTMIGFDWRVDPK